VEYHIYKDTDGHWRWRLIAANNRRIANSGEWFHNKSDCLASVNLVKNSKDAPVIYDD
jgi:uncharacterized protein